MSIKNNVAKAAIAAGLSIAMTLGSIAPATMALAEGTAADSTITISNVDGNVTNFKGYQIFKATVVDGTDGTKTVSNITWANGAVKAAVEGVIKAQDTAYAGTTAQDAADWIKANKGFI